MSREKDHQVVNWEGKPYLLKEDQEHIILTDLEATVKYKQEVELIFPKGTEGTQALLGQVDRLFSATMKNIIHGKD